MDLIAMVQSRVNVLLIVAIIVILEVVKRTLVSKGVNVSSSVWKFSVLIAGLLAALLTFDYTDFSFQQLIVDSIVYSGVATVVYQTSKEFIQNAVRSLGK